MPDSSSSAIDSISDSNMDESRVNGFFISLAKIDTF